MMACLTLDGVTIDNRNRRDDTLSRGSSQETMVKALASNMRNGRRDSKVAFVATTRLMFCRWAVMPIFILMFSFPPRVLAWDWSYYIGGSKSSKASGRLDAPGSTLSLEEISAMRVRDIKWHLTRRHGFGADEVGRILDKKELIEALAVEEDKSRRRYEGQAKRRRVQSSILWSLAAVAVVICWPLIKHAFDIASVNVIVYTDRIRYESDICREYRCVPAAVGFVCMLVLDALQLWLSVSVALSWFIRRSRWFFPTPSLPLRPGQFMGEEVAKSQVGSYGINVGPMLLTWAMRFVHAKMETWTGRALVRAQKERRRSERAAETPQQRADRKEAKRVARQHEAELQAARTTAAQAGEASGTSMQTRARPYSSSGMEPVQETSCVAHTDPSPVPSTSSQRHKDFLREIDEHVCPLDDVD
jgi:hypothetical protein